MKHKKQLLIVAGLALVIAFIQCTKTFDDRSNQSLSVNMSESGRSDKDKSLEAEGKEIFRFDTFGDEDFWSGLLHIDKAILGAANGGYGPGVSPTTALSVGLKVDAEALPPEVVAEIISNPSILANPLTTVALLKLNAVVGVKGTFTPQGHLQSIGSKSTFK